MNNNTQRSAEEIAEAIWKRGQMGKPCTEEICKRAIVEALSLERQEAEKWRMAFNTVIDQKGDLLQEKIRYFEEAEKLRQAIGYNPKIDDMDSITYAQAVMQQFREAVKEVEKLHQENEVLLEYKHFIEKFRMRRPEHPDDERPWVPMLMDSERKNDTLTKENEALKAQVEGLVGALEKIVNERGMTLECASKVMSIIDEALSTLPSTFLEIQKAKDACVETLKRIKENASSTMSFEMIECEAEEALRTLQQAQEKV